MTIRTVTLPGTAITASAIGFGCASLGSRISPSVGLRALEEAFDAGVTWYDVAPPYGSGEAEAILGTFLRGRRDRVGICTKVGLLGPKQGGLMRLAYTLARPLAGQLKALRKGFRAVPATRYRRVPLDADTIRASLEASLRRLGTDHVDVFALHDPEAVDVTRDDVMRVLETVVTGGKARAVSVAGSLSACLAGAGHGAPYHLAQIADDPAAGTLDQFRAGAARPLATITHSVFGVSGALERLTGRLNGDAAARRRLEQAGYDGPVEAAAARLLMDRALASNAEGIVLASMFSPAHRSLNIARAEGAARPEAMVLVRELLEGDATP